MGSGSLSGEFAGGLGGEAIFGDGGGGGGGGGGSGGAWPVAVFWMLMFDGDGWGSDGGVKRGDRPPDGVKGTVVS